MTAISIGTPALTERGESGHVVGVTQAPGGQYMLTGGAGPMAPVRQEVEVCFPNRMTTVPDSIAAPWIALAAARQLPRISESQAIELKVGAGRAQAARNEAARLEREEADRAREAFLTEARARCPDWAQAVIVGRLVEDESDSMTDYFGSRTVRTVILAFSRHRRDLFPELRKAARNYPETAPLADAPAGAEHREKYSMGAGYFLKDGTRHGSGWKVEKLGLYNGADSIPVGEWALDVAPAASTSTAEPAARSSGAAIEEHAHSKHGFAMFIVIMAERVERDRFEQLRDAARSAGGWYSRAWGKCPAGFAFKDRDKAEAFAAEHFPAAPAIAEPAPAAALAVQAAPAAAAPGRAPGLAAKLRALADGMAAAVEDKFRDRRMNTPKQQREAQSARLDGYQLQRAQRGLYMLADHHDAGTVPAELLGVRTKGQALDLARAKISSSGGYYDAGHETGEPAADTPAARAFWAMVGGTSADTKAAELLRQKVAGLRFAKIPGFFPTPPAVIAQMIEAANIPADGCELLEPSAGSGAILDAVREAVPGCRFLVFERHLTLREILDAKGYDLTGDDFTQWETPLRVARVLMNPPFEKGQDMAHVRRAFDHLEVGGRLVSIMSPGPFFREDRASREFRAWFEAVGGEKVELPSGSFKASGTGAGSVMVIIDRDGPAPAAREISEDAAQDPVAPDPTAVADGVPDMVDVKAHETAKRALEIAAAGGLSIYLRADAGQGKTMLIAATKPLGEFEANEGREGPMVDHDLFVDMYPVCAADQVLPYPAETTAMVAQRVTAAKARLGELCPGFASLPLAKVAAVAEKLVQEPGRRLMAAAIEAMQLSPEQTARTYRTALVICALAGSHEVGRVHIAEALSYRRQQPLRQPRREKSEAECRLIRDAWAKRQQLRQRASAAAADAAELEVIIAALRAEVTRQAAQIERLARGRRYRGEMLRRRAAALQEARATARRQQGQIEDFLRSCPTLADLPEPPTPVVRSTEPPDPALVIGYNFAPDVRGPGLVPMLIAALSDARADQAAIVADAIHYHGGEARARSLWPSAFQRLAATEAALSRATA